VKLYPKGFGWVFSASARESPVGSTLYRRQRNVGVGVAELLRKSSLANAGSRRAWGQTHSARPGTGTRSLSGLLLSPTAPAASDPRMGETDYGKSRFRDHPGTFVRFGNDTKPKRRVSIAPKRVTERSRFDSYRASRR
jgi:hypothetical protein